MIKTLFEAIPLIAPYPGWVKGLVSTWVLLTAVCVAVLLTVSTKPAIPNKEHAVDGKIGANQSSRDQSWLKINKVLIYDGFWDDAGVRVTATINKNKYVYPDVPGINWVVTGPDMSPGLYRIPPSDEFEILFSMDARKEERTKYKGDINITETKFVSQHKIIIHREELPKYGNYALHELDGGGRRGGGISAEISYTISNRPD